MGNDLRAELAPRLENIETALRMLFDGYAKGSPSILREAMEYSLFSGGKRLRPMLCGLACEAVGGRFEQSLPAGVAVEMIHTYSLIHDDLPAMDDDDLRRGRPTCHKVYGDALAILAGDGLQAMAFQVIASCYPPLISSVMMKELAKGSGAAGMVGGQVLPPAAITQSTTNRLIAEMPSAGIAMRRNELFSEPLPLGIISISTVSALSLKST